MIAARLKMQNSDVSEVSTDISRPLNGTGSVNPSVNDQLVYIVEQVVPESTEEQPIDSIAYFFAAGLLVNLLLISAYFIWAYRQWNTKRGEDNN